MTSTHHQPRGPLKRPPDQLLNEAIEENETPSVLLQQEEKKEFRLAAAVPDDRAVRARRRDEDSDGRQNIYRADPSYNSRGGESHYNRRTYDDRYTSHPPPPHHGGSDDNRQSPFLPRPNPHRGYELHQQGQHRRPGQGSSTQQPRDSSKRPPNQLSQEEENRLRQHRRGTVSPHSLHCRPLKDTEQPQELWWRCEVDPIPIATEKILVDVLLPNGEREKGMMREKPKSFLKRIKGVCQQHGVDMSTACSLRRHHIKKYNMNKTMSSLRLGPESHINAAAAIFEEVVAEFLRKEQIDFYDEQEQRAFINKKLPQGRRYPVTPDFILKQPVLLRTYRQNEVKLEDGTTEFQRGEVTQELVIHCKCLSIHRFAISSDRTVL
jgi:hypothetical protein